MPHSTRIALVPRLTLFRNFLSRLEGGRYDGNQGSRKTRDNVQCVRPEAGALSADVSAFIAFSLPIDKRSGPVRIYLQDPARSAFSTPRCWMPDGHEKFVAELSKSVKQCPNQSPVSL